MTDQELPRIEKALLIGGLIRQVQKELIESQRQRTAEGEPALFQVESLAIEAHFIVTESTQAKGGFDLKILTSGGQRTFAKEQVHKITLTLKTAPHEEDDAGLEGLDMEPSGRRPRRG